MAISKFVLMITPAYNMFVQMGFYKAQVMLINWCTTFQTLFCAGSIYKWGPCSTYLPDQTNIPEANTFVSVNNKNQFHK